MGWNPANPRFGQKEVVVEPNTRRVVRYHVSLVGSDLTASLRWCETHYEPVWVHTDGSFECPHTRIVEHDTHDHVIVSGPWEVE